jgi:hypothetical protein
MYVYIGFLNQTMIGQDGVVMLSYHDRPKYLGTFIEARRINRRRALLLFSKKSLVLDLKPKVLSIEAMYLASKKGRVSGEHPECHELWIGKINHEGIIRKLGGECFKAGKKKNSPASICHDD